MMTGDDDDEEEEAEEDNEIHLKGNSHTFFINFERTLPNYKHWLFTGSMAYPIPYHKHP